MNQRGFTLLEVMVATLIMGIAVVGLMSGISQSLRNADRVIDYDRAALLARSKMDDLLLNYQLPKGTVISGSFDPVILGGKEGGWRAKISEFDRQPKRAPRRPLATAEDRIFICKTGFEQFMFAASRRSALVYGLATVILALFTGWLAGVIFRRD